VLPPCSMIRSYLPAAACAALLLSACSDSDTAQQGAALARFEVTSRDENTPDAASRTMPGKIDPPAAVWRENGNGARYGEPDQKPLLDITCQDGLVAVTRNIGSDAGAKALLAFVGYRGILRLKVENDGKAWHGALRADDPHWTAVTGGPFYATVAGGGKVISPASAIAAGVIRDCKPEPDATIKGTDGEVSEEAGAAA